MAENASYNSNTMFVEINSQRIPLDVGQLYLLGKHSEGNKTNNCIKLEEADEDIEPKHCIIEVGHGEDVYVFDLFSSKGTFVNNTRLKGLEKLRLKNGDILKVGKQEIKFHHDQQEVSHDSSGFLEVNKNTSDIIPSSPDSTSQHESRIKRPINNNFLVPAVPAKKSMTPNNSLVIPETEAMANVSRNSLNASTNSRRSDSFTIPETQYCKARNSLNDSDLSIAESNPDVSGNKIKFNFGNLDDFANDDDEDDFCIPETQEVLPASSQRPRLLSEVKEKSILLEESTKDEEDADDKELEGSQFRICTQDYNEGFGEESNVGLHSQIIPIIKHPTVILNTTAKSSNENSINQSKLEEEDKELSAVRWSNSNVDQETTALRADCSTPDIFEFGDLQPDTANAKEADNVAKSAEEAKHNVPDEDEEDLLPTQAFVPTAPTKQADNRNAVIVPDKPCLDKENEEVLTLSDKENRCPTTLEPITDLPPTQLLEFPSTARSTSSSASRNSLTTPAVTEHKNNSKSLLDIDIDEEDDLLTQAFLQPTNAPTTSTTAAQKNIPTIKCFNSTVLEDKLNVKNPATFFAEMEKTPLKPKTSPLSNFKVPVLKKTSSATSTTSETDMDLLMCTPQLIKEHLFVDKTEDLRKNILAVKNKHLFGDETDEEEENEEDDDQSDLVKLINIPKDSLDFDKLLPHLKPQAQTSNKSKEQQAAQEAQKLYKFDISFGKEQDKNQAKSRQSKSDTLSRDERHATRDKEREMAERRGRSKKKDNSRNHSKEQDKDKSHEKKTKQKETKSKTPPEEQDEQNTSTEKDQGKQKSSTKHNKHKSNTSDNEKSKQEQDKNKQEEDEQKSSTKQEKTTRQRKRKASSDTTEATKEMKKEEEQKQMPARRMTRAKSKHEEKPSTSKEAAARMAGKSKPEPADDLDSISTQPYEEDDLDSIATQPYEDDLNVVNATSIVRITRCRSTSKQSESQESISTNNSLRKTGQNNKSKNYSSLSNTSANGNITTKTTGERKRKAEATPPVMAEKVERKRLRSTHSQESSSTTNSNTSSPILISMTMVEPELFKDLIKHCKGFWNIAKNPADSEILVMDKAFRTFKFLLAMARGIPIVTSQYLKKLNESQTPKKVKIQDYLFVDEEFEKKHKFSLIKSMQLAKKHKIFKGIEFVMTNNILPNPQEIKAIIEASGGYVHAKNPPAPKDNQQIYLVSAKEDKKDWHKYRRINKNIIIVSTEAVMSSIMRQTSERLNCYTLS